MSDNTELIARLLNESGVGTALINDRVALMDKAAEALIQAERDLTDLGTAFRDYKIVHPEGTEDLHRKLAEQDATIKAVEEIAMHTVWVSETVEKLRAILTRTKDTR